MKHAVIVTGLLFLGASAPLMAQRDAGDSTQLHPQWISISDSVGRVIGMTEQQRSDWKPRNAQWDGKYKALGTRPERSRAYIKLHSAREIDLKGFLTGGQYDKWRQLNRRSPRLESNNPPGTNMPADR